VVDEDRTRLLVPVSGSRLSARCPSVTMSYQQRDKRSATERPTHTQNKLQTFSFYCCIPRYHWFHDWCAPYTLLLLDRLHTSNGHRRLSSSVVCRCL